MSFWRAPNSILDVPSFVFEEFGQNYCETSKRDAQGGWAAKTLQNIGFLATQNGAALNLWKKPQVLQYKRALGRFSSSCCLHAFLIQKIFRKPLKNHVGAALKSFLKMHCFLISVFGRLGLHLKSFWTPRWSQVRHSEFQKTHHSRLWGPSEIRRFFTNVVLESPELDFGRPELCFWRVWEG